MTISLLLIIYALSFFPDQAKDPEPAQEPPVVEEKVLELAGSETGTRSHDVNLIVYFKYGLPCAVPLHLLNPMHTGALLNFFSFQVKSRFKYVPKPRFCKRV